MTTTYCLTVLAILAVVVLAMVGCWLAEEFHDDNFHE